MTAARLGHIASLNKTHLRPLAALLFTGRLLKDFFAHTRITIKQGCYCACATHFFLQYIILESLQNAFVSRRISGRQCAIGVISRA